MRMRVTSSNLCYVTVNERKERKLNNTDIYFIIKTRDKELDSRKVIEHILIPAEQAYGLAGFVGYALGHRHDLTFAIETKTDNALEDLRVEIFFMKNLDESTFEKVSFDVLDMIPTYLLATA